MKRTEGVIRLLSLLLLLAMLVGILPVNVLAEQLTAAAEARENSVAKTAVTESAQTRGYYDLGDRIPDYEGCNGMQGMALLGDYIYSIKKNSGDSLAVIYRTNRFDGTTEQMNFEGALTVDYLGHGNDMCAAQVEGTSYLFVSTMKKTLNALACFKISGTTLILVDVFDIYTKGGSNLTCSGVDVYEVDGTKLTLLIAQGDLVFMYTMDMTAPPEALYCPLAFQVDLNYALEVARTACGNSELELTVQGSGYYKDTYYMPLTLHHNHSTQIKADNHADSTSVIVAFPNIADAIKVTDRSVKASLADSIYIPDAGEMFFEVESLDFADGMLYFNTNRIRIDHSETVISVLLDAGVDMKIFSDRKAYRQDGVYMLSGASATDNFLYDPGAADGHLEAGKYPAGTNVYFGLESNGEGFYYIRSMRTKEYLTVNEDCTVTKSAKKENDSSQLFCLTQVNWPNEPGHVAIISLLNYQYLNNESGTTKSITTTSGKTYRLQKVKDTAALEEYLFDYKLYTACYPEETAGMTEAQAREHYNTVGKKNGYVASVFFDPEYYFSEFPGLRDHASFGSYEGAYNHFLNYGFWEGRQGSLFFSCNEYLHSGNDKLKSGDYPDKVFYLEHFRNYGANESLTREDRYGSDEFPVEKVVEKFGITATGGYDFLVEYISRNVALSRVTTQEELEKLFFDWEYYAEANSFTEEGLKNFAGTTFEEKLYSHWIQYGINEGRVASPYFRASYYLQKYSDVGTSKADAYNHFVTTGFWEGRAGSAYYDGESYLYGLNPEKSVVCSHTAKVTQSKAATCSEEGSVSTLCYQCLTLLQSTKLAKAAHTPVTDKAVAPTETKTGLTEGSHCSACNLILVEQTVVPALSASYRSSYDLCESLPLIENCFSMQGMALLGDYIYTVKINGANDKAVIFRTSRLDGATEAMTIDAKAYASNLQHANDMCAATVAGKDYLFVSTLVNGDGGMVAYEMNGTSLTTLGVYDLYQTSGAAITSSGINTYAVSGNKVELMITSASYTFKAVVDVTAAPGKLFCEFMFKLDTQNMLAAAQAATGLADTEMTVQGAGYGNDTFYVPIGISHEEIKADNHRDHTSVILVYPNISQAIASKNAAVTTTADNTIYLPHSGDVFSEVESVAVADGIIYINTNRIRIDNSITCAISFLTDPESQTNLMEKRAAFCQDGLYLLRGSSATEYLVVDPSAEDTHLTVQKTSPGTSTYFGFESNEQGYYYIRSHLSGLYLTVGADGSVTQSAKKENDVSQLWALTQVDWPHNPLKVAIISMRNYGYLNLDSATMTVLTNNSGKTFLLEEVLNTAGLEANLFDYQLYTACYPEETAGMTEAQAKEHWVSTGRAKGYVASIFFDPKYYLANESDLAAAYGADNYEAAYQHFVSTGFWEGRQGSLFYDCKDNVNYVNFKYDKEYYPNKEKFVRHFYLYGANECLTRNDVVRRGSEEFDLKQVVAEFGLEPTSGYAFLVEYISRNIRLSAVSTQAELESLLFDWEYYAAKNPELTEANVAAFAGGTYAEKLRSHWFQKGIGEGRSASPYFDAAFYLANYTDVGTTAGAAYEHFVKTGFWAKRAGSAYYDGESYLYGLNPRQETVCEHIATVTAKGEPTCTTGAGATTYCCYCSKVITTETLPALGHTEVVDAAVAASCTETGLTEGKHCSVCSTVLKVQETVPAKGHTEVVDAAVAATCTKTGLTEGKHCSACDAVILAQQIIPATGHINTTAETTDATCTESGSVVVTCACGEVVSTEIIAALGHAEVVDAAVAASCTETGLTEGKHCSVCSTVLKAQEIVPAKGHTEVVDAAVAATCTETGLTEGKHCSVCDAVIVAQQVVPAAGHSVNYIKMQSATCTQDGYIHHYCCEGCGKCFADADAKLELPEDYLKIAASGHIEVVTEAVDATCAKTGLTEGKHCAVCGEVLVAQAEIAAVGHSYEGTVIAPTCTISGYTIYTCADCGDSYVAEEIAALGHNPSTLLTLPTCTTTGSVTVTCSLCGENICDETIPALGHSYEYINDGATHKIVCKNRCDATNEAGEGCEHGCNYLLVEEHSFTEGICVCGALEVVDTVVDENLTFGAQLYLENDLTMAFRVKGSKLANYEVSTAYLVVEREVYESGATEAIIVSTTISEYTVSADGRYVFSYPGIAAAQMNDAIRATLYIKDTNGKEYVSPVLHTSVATYLDGLLSNSTSDAKLMTLIMDMVNYGAAAQVYFDRHADAPVNEAFQSFKTYASYASADFTTVLEDLSGTTANEGATGKLNQGLDLGTRIGIQYKVTLPKGINAEDATLVITDKNGNELETIEVASGTIDSKGRYIVNFYGSTSKDMRRVVYATAYANGAAITGTYAYSISTYAWGIQENASAMDANLVAVTRMMMLYGDSASAYFA